ncbi:MAG: hypothetical protein ACYC0V_08140 [Armatimonadota bacterium]
MNITVAKIILLVAVLIGAIWYQEGINHSVRLLEAKTSIQIGMSENQATQIMGSSPRIIRKGEQISPKLTFSEAVRCPNDKVLLYNSIIPAYYVVVHVNPKGLIDAILFKET